MSHSFYNMTNSGIHVHAVDLTYISHTNLAYMSQIAMRDISNINMIYKPAVRPQCSSHINMTCILYLSFTYQYNIQNGRTAAVLEGKCTSC